MSLDGSYSRVGEGGIDSLLTRKGIDERLSHATRLVPTLAPAPKL